MPWSVAAPIAGAVVSSALSSSGSKTNGGAGTQTATKEPWLQAQPWMTNNMASGQALQSQYTAQPFNQQQLSAYQNLGNQTNYVNQLTPSLLGQISGQQLGFDRANPNAKPTAYNFNGTGSGGSGQGGLLNMLANPSTSATSAANPAPAAAAAQPDNGGFVNQGSVFNGMGATYSPTAISGILGQGKYGSFTYGQKMPDPGTQAYRDMSAYFANGGTDPSNFYGRGGALGSILGMGGNGAANGGNGSVGGSPGTDGSGGGSAGVY